MVLNATPGNWWRVSVCHCLVMRRRHVAALLVLTLAVGLATGRHVSEDAKEGSSKRSPRVFVNTSIPFSVAPQPVPDTAEVALAKERFMRTFEMIRDAIIAADAAQLDLTQLEHDIRNHLEHFEDRGDDDAGTHHTTTEHVHEETTTAIPAPTSTHVPPVLRTEVDDIELPIFPDPVMEPEFFLSSVHVDPLLLSQLDMELPPNYFVQEMRPLGANGNGGTCYEMILLEPETEHFGLPFGGVHSGPGALSFPSHSSLLDSLAKPIQGRTRSRGSSSSPSQQLIVGTPAVQGNRTDFSRVTKTSRSHTLNSDDIPDTASAVSSAFRAAHQGSPPPTIPAHFRSPQLTFGGGR